MSHSEPAPIAARRSAVTILATLVVVAATLGVIFAGRLVVGPLASGQPGASRGRVHPAPGQRGHARPGQPPPTPTSWSLLTTRRDADGAVRRGVAAFDEQKPAIANLDPDLRRALRDAAMRAAYDGIEIVVNSGWRSAQYQDRLLREAVLQHGSEEKATRWVAPAGTSSHVSGHAVDIGPSRAMAWLSRHGAEYRLCQIYRNEPWHYELRPEATADGCPSMYADPRHDPRMHQ